MRKSYLMIFDTTPAPTVWPPSRIANLRPSSIAIGWISWAFIRMLSPGITGAVELPEGTEMVMPGDNIRMKAQLIHPIAMEEGLRFAIREGGHTVGAGVVSKIIK